MDPTDECVTDVAYVNDDDVAEALDQDIRGLLSTCFTKATDSVFIAQRYFREMPQHRWMIRSESGSLVGHVAVHEKQVRTETDSFSMGGVSEVCVHPDFRGRGLVQVMLSDTHEWLMAHDFQFSALFGPPKVYEPCGYVSVDNLHHHAPKSPPENISWENSSSCMIRELSSEPWPTDPVYLDSRSF